MDSPFQPRDIPRPNRNAGSQPSTPTAPGDMDVNSILKALGLGNQDTGQPSGKNNKGGNKSGGNNPFGAASAEFNIAPMAQPVGVINDPLARIRSGLPEYDNLVQSMYAPPPTPAPPPAGSRLISALSPQLQARLSQIWGKIGKGGTMPTTLDDFLTYYRANPMPNTDNGAVSGGTRRTRTYSPNPNAAQGH